MPGPPELQETRRGNIGASTNGIEFGGIVCYSSNKEPIKAPTVCSLLGLGFRVLKLGMLGVHYTVVLKRNPQNPILNIKASTVCSLLGLGLGLGGLSLVFLGLQV